MKAITCSQCGALIEDVSLKTSFVRCNYCKANVLIIDEKILEISKREAEEAQRKRHEWKRNEEKTIREYRESQANEVENHSRWMATQIIVLIIILLLPFLLYYIFNG
jgi:DNA-directed RNA polymerase subunit RPC12/RpoP